MTSRCFVVAMPFGCAKNFRSEGTLSSLGRSTPSRIRPHSAADRLPGYACNTVSSQLRFSRCDVKRSHVGCICPRFSKFCVKACEHFMVTMGILLSNSAFSVFVSFVVCLLLSSYACVYCILRIYQTFL